jgi:putative glutathione S-transferase
MGRLIDGRWVAEDLGVNERGEYVRRAASFRDAITADGSSGFAAEAGRYHLYLSWACGWSHRTLLLRTLKGLEEVIGLSVVDNHMGEEGWTFSEGADPIGGFRALHQLYVAAQADYTGRVSVPILWDRKTGTIVSNESLEIAAMFDREFQAFARDKTRYLPDEHRDAILAMLAVNYEAINNGVYKAGFAGSQAAHEAAVTALFARFDELEEHLSTSRYLCGPTVTLADLCLFTTLYRFDPVYHYHFKCNVRRLRDYPHLWGYTRDLYQLPGVRETCRLDAVKEHYYTSHESINPRRLIPLGPSIDYDAPHAREGVGPPREGPTG